MGTPLGTRKHEEVEDRSREQQDEEISTKQLAKKSEKTGIKKGRELPSPKVEMKGLGKRSISDGDAARTERSMRGRQATGMSTRTRGFRQKKKDTEQR